jgi:YD repeat-containing protein
VTYTAEGNLASTKDPLGRTTGGFSYDTFGNLRFATNLLAGTTVAFSHDANGNRTNSSRQWINPTNGADVRTIETKRVFDAEGKETVTTDPEGNQSSVVYNEIGAPDQVIDRYGHPTTRVYDARGNVIQITHPDGTLARSIYDDGGRLSLSEDSHLPGAAVTGTRYTYDAVGQTIRSEKLTNVVINVLTNRIVPESILVSIGAVLSTNASSFDAAGRLLATTNALGRVTRYEYDKAGRQTAVIDALSNRTDYAYDAAGRLITTTNALGKVTRYEYDLVGRRVRTIFPDASFTGTAYNELGQRLRETNQLGLVTDFEIQHQQSPERHRETCRAKSRRRHQCPSALGI